MSANQIVPDKMAQASVSSPRAVPSLAAGTRLYFDSQHQRWVIKAPHQVVFLDPVSLDVLRACEGERNLVAIALSMDALNHRPGRAWLDVVTDIVRHFEARGVLRCRLEDSALSQVQRPLQGLAERLLERRSSTK
uniref:hypothetical protein n=1 Tax=Marinobacterium profundum TaxID=1714300 RepID=UPI00082BADD0|nr:hypothetical protein [Marinobacterium profundum]